MCWACCSTWARCAARTGIGRRWCAGITSLVRRAISTASAGQWLPYLVVLSAGMLMVGMVWGLAFAPPHHEQGNSYRIIYLHVPAASGALMGYSAMSLAGLVALVWRLKMAEIVIKAIAPFWCRAGGGGADHRRHLGAAHMGHLLDLGCTADFHADPVLHVPGRDCLAERDQ